jgi:hypothetical protein
MNGTSKSLMPVIVLFILSTALIFLFRSFLEEHNFSWPFLAIANLFLFAISFFGFYLQLRGLESGNINLLLRGVYASLLIKIFVVIIALGIYLVLAKGKINKPSLFTTMGLYIVYTVIEVRQLLKISRKKVDD